MGCSKNYESSSYGIPQGKQIFCLAKKLVILTLPKMSTGSLEFSRTGFTLSPDNNPFTGFRLSKIASYLALSSTWF